MSARDCVQCKAFQKGPKKDTCDQCEFKVILVDKQDELPQPGQVPSIAHCKEKDENDCWFYFSYSVNDQNVPEVHVTKNAGKTIVFWASSTMIRMLQIVGKI